MKGEDRRGGEERREEEDLGRGRVNGRWGCVMWACAAVAHFATCNFIIGMQRYLAWLPLKYGCSLHVCVCVCVRACVC